MRRPAILLMIAALAVLGACKDSKPQTPPQANPFKLNLWSMNLQVQPEAPQMDSDMTFRLKMTDVQGEPVNGAQVSGALVMTTMDMGKNEVPFSEEGAGVYQGTGKVDMAGPWELVVTAKVAGMEGQKKFPLTVGR